MTWAPPRPQIVLTVQVSQDDDSVIDDHKDIFWFMPCHAARFLYLIVFLGEAEEEADCNDGSEDDVCWLRNEGCHPSQCSQYYIPLKYSICNTIFLLTF